MAQSLSDLPDLPLIEIFKHLGLVDRTRARAISRRWKALIDGCTKFDELVVTNGEPPKRWFVFNKEIDPNSVFQVDLAFQMFDEKIIDLPLLSSLKRLIIEDWDSKLVGAPGTAADCLYRCLAKYTALEHLQVGLSMYEYSSFWLVHPNVKVLSFRFFLWHDNNQLHIDCPRLKVLRCTVPYSLCTIVHPETIEQLFDYPFTCPIWGNLASSSDLEAFANVELYVCEDISTVERVNIWSLPKLKELRLNAVGWSKAYVLSVLTELIAKKKLLGPARVSTKIYLNDKECSEKNLRESHDWLFQDDEDSTGDE